MRFINCIVILLFFAGCRVTKPAVVQVPVEARTTITERLVPIAIPGDSAVLIALFECDSNYNVLLKQFNEVKSQRLGSELSFAAGRLDYNVTKPSDSVHVVERAIEVEREVPVEVPVTTTVNVLTGWQWVQIWLGRIAAGVFILSLILSAITKKWK